MKSNFLIRFAMFAGLLSSAASAVDMATSYVQNFDAMGTSGTTPPAGWSLKVAAGGATTWTDATGIPLADVAAMTAAPTPLTAIATPSAGLNNGYNASGAATGDRLLATCPTGNAGTSIELSLTNISGTSISAIRVGYQTRRYAGTATVSELPGYRFFYSQNGGTSWTEVTGLRPTITTVPNTAGVTVTPVTPITLGSAWAANGTLLLRWVDDNGAAGPDQVVGLDNVTVDNSSIAGTELTQNFNGMTTGTTPPTGWTMWNGNSGSNSDSWTDATGITSAGANSVATMVAAPTPLTASTAPTATNNNGYNAQVPGDSANRVLATSPTTIAGASIQWKVANPNGFPVNRIRLGYDIQRFTAAATANELPGYHLRYSLDNGTTWSAAAAFAPTLAGTTGVVVPNTVGVTNVPPAEIILSGAWAAGADLSLRWVDDNADQSSPDQIVGLDNVVLATFQSIGNSPTTSITSPVANANFGTPGDVTINASASDSDGTITKVQFFTDGVLLSEDSSSPYTATWSNPSIGSHSLTTTTFDNNGNPGSSVPVAISVVGLTREPYLQMARPTGMTIRWSTSQSFLGKVKWRKEGDVLFTDTVETSSGLQHLVDLNALTPATKYFYRVSSTSTTEAGSDATMTFTTPPVAGAAVDTLVWVLGDAGRAGNHPTEAVNQLAVKSAFNAWASPRTPDMILQLGDNAYDSGTETEFQKGVFDIYTDEIRRTPMWSCLGNHETSQVTALASTASAPYFGIYTLPKNAECGGVASNSEHYYSWNYGNIHFVSLDSMTTEYRQSGTTAMANWLKQDLDANTSTWTVCFFHHPPYTSKGSHNSDDLSFNETQSDKGMSDMRTIFVPIMEARGVDLVLSGHNHCYERSYMVDGHTGTSTTFTESMKKSTRNGTPVGTSFATHTGDGEFLKPLFTTDKKVNQGAVYVVAGSAGEAPAGSTRPKQPVHLLELAEFGSVGLRVNGTKLTATFVEPGTIGTPVPPVVKDTFTIIKTDLLDLAPPTVSNITTTGATVSTSINPNGSVTTGQFELGTTTSYGANVPLTLSPNDGTAPQALGSPVTGLLSGTTYHIRTSATNARGLANSLDVVFTTLPEITVSSPTLTPWFGQTGSISGTYSNAAGTVTMTATKNGQPFGTVTWSAGTWTWTKPDLSTADNGQVVINISNGLSSSTVTFTLTVADARFSPIPDLPLYTDSANKSRLLRIANLTPSAATSATASVYWGGSLQSSVTINAPFGFHDLTLAVPAVPGGQPLPWTTPVAVEVLDNLGVYTKRIFNVTIFSSYSVSTPFHLSGTSTGSPDPSSISDNGMVTGYAYTTAFTTDGYPGSEVPWFGNGPAATSASLLPKILTGNEWYGYGNSVNNLGVIAGSGYSHVDLTDEDKRPLVWLTTSSTPIPLETTGRGQATGINDSNEISGNWEPPTGGYNAVFWSIVNSVPARINLPGAGSYSTALAINNKGTIAGIKNFWTGTADTCVWEKNSSGGYDMPVALNPPTGGYRGSYPVITDSGMVYASYGYRWKKQGQTWNSVPESLTYAYNSVNYHGLAITGGSPNVIDTGIIGGPVIWNLTPLFGSSYWARCINNKGQLAILIYSGTGATVCTPVTTP